MGLVYKDLMGKMGIDDEGLFELAYCELDYISNELQKIYKSPYISDLNSYILFAIRKMLDSWQSIHLLCEDRIDVSSLVTLSRMIVDNYTILHFIHINSKTIEERELRHYLYVLDGVENRIKELRKFPSLTFDLNYIEQTEIDQLAQQIETTMQSDLKAKDQLLKKIRNNPLCNVDMENIIQRRNWKYKKLNNTIKGNRFSWLELYQQAGIKNSVSQFISGYMSEFVHGLCMSNIAYNTPPFEKGQILNINTVFINKTTDIIKTYYNYKEKDMNVLIMKPGDDKKAGSKIQNRAGAELNTDYVVSPSVDIYNLIAYHLIENNTDCIIVDEAQFLTPKQVDELTEVVDEFNIPVLCYGLRADAFSHAFPGSQRLFEVADRLEELKAICKCGEKATYNLRLNRVNDEYIPVFEGEQISIDGIDADYDSVCRPCYKKLRRQYGKKKEEK